MGNTVVVVLIICVSQYRNLILYIFLLLCFSNTVQKPGSYNGNDPPYGGVVYNLDRLPYVLPIQKIEISPSES